MEEARESDNTATKEDRGSGEHSGPRCRLAAQSHLNARKHSAAQPHILHPHLASSCGKGDERAGEKNENERSAAKRLDNG